MTSNSHISKMLSSNRRFRLWSVSSLIQSIWCNYVILKSLVQKKSINRVNHKTRYSPLGLKNNKLKILRFARRSSWARRYMKIKEISRKKMEVTKQRISQLKTRKHKSRNRKTVKYNLKNNNLRLMVKKIMRKKVLILRSKYHMTMMMKAKLLRKSSKNKIKMVINNPDKKVLILISRHSQLLQARNRRVVYQKQLKKMVILCRQKMLIRLTEVRRRSLV